MKIPYNALLSFFKSTSTSIFQRIKAVVFAIIFRLSVSEAFYTFFMEIRMEKPSHKTEPVKRGNDTFSDIFFFSIKEMSAVTVFILLPFYNGFISKNIAKILK